MDFYLPLDIADMRNETTVTKEFFPVWKKYRPVILKLMIDSLEGAAQSYQLSQHEFSDVNSRKSALLSFKLEAHKGRVLYPKEASVVTSDLLILLKQSAKAMELMDASVFTFVLDTQFNLTISSVLSETAVEEMEENV